MPSDPNANETPLQVTSPESWGANAAAAPVATQMIELPSGNVVEARRTLSILRVVQEGQIPNPLRGVILRMITAGDMDMPTGAQHDMKLMTQFADFLDSVAVDTVINPPIDRPTPRGKVVDKSGKLVNPEETGDEYYERIEKWVPKKGHLSVFQLDANDKMFLFIFAQGAAADAKTFRALQEQSVEPVADVKKPPRPTKRTGGAKRKPTGKK